MKNRIKIKLPVNRMIGKESFAGMSEFTLNLVTTGKKVDVYFWRPSVNENGAHFLTVPKTDVARLKRACASTL